MRSLDQDSKKEAPPPAPPPPRPSRPESPIWNFLNSLPPIMKQPVKSHQGKQEFDFGLESLPFEFTPPRIDAHSEPLFLEMFADENLVEDPYGSDLLLPSEESMKDHHHFTPYLMSQPQQNVRECEDCAQMGPSLHASAENMSRDGSENNYRVVRRRLQFEDAASNALGRSNNYPLPAHIPDMSLDITTSSKNKMVKQAEPTTCIPPPQFRRNFPVTGSNPSGIGSHLNNTTNTTPPSKGKSITTDDDGKRCNCKKSECLKLYCECFASEYYCADRCSCKGCYNRPEYEDIIDDIKRQIKSRNPIAFEPKILQHATDIPSKDEAPLQKALNMKTPSSARHKKGCTCKRSKCLKSYCECYQVNVGCSPRCQCRGCKNSYGRREDHVARENALRNERIFGRNMQCSDQGRNWPMGTSLCNPASLSRASRLSSKLRDWGQFPQPLGSTPMTCSLSEIINPHCLESDSSIYDSLEGEIAAILKEASTPINSAKATSSSKPSIDSKGNGDEGDPAENARK